MRCANCGHENSEFATHCAACGAVLQEVAEEPQASLDATVELPTPASIRVETAQASTEPDTERKPEPIEAPRSASEAGAVSEPDTERRETVFESSPEPERKGVAHEARVLVRDKGHKVGGFFARNQRPLAIACALIVVAVTGVVWLLLSLSTKPETAELERDLATRVPAFAYTGGTYGFDTVITLSDVTIESLEPTDTPEAAQATEGVGANAYLAVAKALYVDSHVSVTHDFTCTYVRTEDGWQPAGDIAEGTIQVEALSGVDEGKVLQNIGDVLATVPTDNGVRLQDIYGTGNVHVADRSFTHATSADKATDTLVLACHRDFSFYSFDGTVTCTFVFDNNEWALVSSVADDTVSKRTNASVAGTWTGTAIDHTASGGTCYGAEGKPLTITIDTIEDIDAAYTTVTGTITGTVHAHPELSRQQMSDIDDLEVTDVPFEGTLITSSDATTGAELTLEATCTPELPERTSQLRYAPTGDEDEDEEQSSKKTNRYSPPNPTDVYEDYYTNLTRDSSGQGTLELSFVMSFGTSSDPGAVFLELTSTYTSQGVVFFVVPRETQSRFTDTYQLVRAN